MTSIRAARLRSEGLIEGFLAAIEASEPARALRISFVAYPLVNAAHLLGAGGLVTTVWLMHLALAGHGPFSHARDLDRFLRRIVVAALVLMAVTGLALFSVKAVDYAANPAFRVKMVLILAALGNIAVYNAAALRGLRQVATILSCLLWPAVLLAGRFIGFL
jgi:hypothetical protein